MRWALNKTTLLAVLLLAGAVFGQTRMPCSILRIVDGCRVELTSGEIVRLIGVQPFSNLQSNLSPISAFLDSLFVGKLTALEFDDNLPETFGYLWRDSVAVNVELLRKGLARIWEDTTQFKYQEIFLAAETFARQSQIGYWKFTLPINTIANTRDDTVYVTKSGKKYHRANCRLLSENKMALPLSQARVERGPCRLCMTAANASALAPQQNDKSKTAATPCLATTKSGERCKRDADSGSKYCWQHRRK